MKAFGKFWGEFGMVAECCTERSWLAGMQPHLVHYVPQAVPFFSWIAWPPFFDHPFYSILPIIALPAFIFYDALAGFNSPSSYAMGPRKTREVFPQLTDVLYSAVYCEAMHNGTPPPPPPAPFDPQPREPISTRTPDTRPFAPPPLSPSRRADARTGTAIALTAASKGATIANYCEMVGFVYGGPEGHTVTGITCKDVMTGETFQVKATAVVLATGAFLDSVRAPPPPAATPPPLATSSLPSATVPSTGPTAARQVRRMDNPAAEKSVAAAAGVHIVLPGYFTPDNMGFANLRTARGATMYFLPWLGHTVVGSTDKKCDATSSPAVTEDEIQRRR